MEQYYTSGNWHVRSGSEEEFIKRWTEFAESARPKARGRFVLIRENDDPKHFVSVGTWSTEEDVRAWMEMPEFKETFAHLGSLCDEYHGGPYSLVTSIG